MGNELESRLAALRAEYAATLPAEVEEAAAALGRVDEEGAAAVEACWQVVHRIYGTAGSYGLDEVAQIARAIEAQLGPHRQASALPPKLRTAVRLALVQLADQASETART